MSIAARWPVLRRVVIAGFLLFVAALLIRYARSVDWPAVADAIAAYPRSRIALAAVVALLAYMVYCHLDVLARSYTGHALPWWRVLSISLVCYAFNLNLGGMIGGVGFRYRLYSQFGLELPTISRLVVFVIGGNWMGFLLLAGLALAFNPLPLPPGWEAGAGALRVAGFGMLLGLSAWLLLCAFSRRRRWSVRGHEVELPSPGMAIGQLALACASWLLIATVLYVLLPEPIAFLTVAGVLALSVVANVITHVPANVGVLEAVFVALLGTVAPAEQILAAVLTYRALFYVGPLLLALAGYLWMEATLRRR